MNGTPFGQYELQELVGEGGMGRVYRAHDTLTGRLVALKLLPSHLAADPAFRRRFLREAQIAAALSEPHVVPIHRFGEIEGQLYVDMRLISGRDLQSEIQRQPLGVHRTIEILSQVASALDAAHGAGLVHRDVKPSNILVTDANFAYLIDFGIARGAEQTALTSVGSTIGTLAYMAPERFESGNCDARSDVYSLACVLFECLAGQPAFPGKTLEQQIAAHMMKPPPRLSDVSTGMPHGLDDVISKGLAKNPNERYATCGDLLQNAKTAAASTKPIATVQGPTVLAPTQLSPLQASSSAETALSPLQETSNAATLIAPPDRPTDKSRILPRRLLLLVASGVVLVLAGTSAVLLRSSGESRQNSDLGSSSQPSRQRPTTQDTTAISVGKVESIAASVPSKIAASGRLIVGVNIPYTPAEFLDTNGRIVGFDVDLMNAISATLGLTAVYREANFANIIPSVQAGEVNVGMSSFTDTKEREQSVDMVNYFEAGTLWATRVGGDVDPDAACGKTVAVQATTTQEIDELPTRSKACTDSGKPAIDIVKFDGQDQATNAVILGKADAMSADSPVTAYAIKLSNGQLEEAGEMFDAAPYGWPVAKGSALSESLSRALDHLIGTGEYSSILSRWGLELGALQAATVNGAVA